MIYVLAAIGVVTLAVLMWKAFGPDTEALRNGSLRGDRPKKNPVAPDDDPEFLRKISEEQRKKGSGEED